MSERKINLENVLRNVLFPKNISDSEWILFFRRNDLLKDDVILAMKEACKQALELAAENADTKIIYFGIGEITVIDEQSILNTINQIE